MLTRGTPHVKHGCAGIDVNLLRDRHEGPKRLPSFLVYASSDWQRTIPLRLFVLARHALLPVPQACAPLIAGLDLALVDEQGVLEEFGEAHSGAL